MKALRLVLAVFCLLCVAPARAQKDEQPSNPATSNVYLEAQLRARGEYRNGQGTLHGTLGRPAWFVAERARLGVGIERKYLSMKFAAQHLGVWGDEPMDGSSKAGSLNVKEAWVGLNLPLGITARVGRQELSYDDERLFGAEDWEMGGYSHDALHLAYTLLGSHRFEAAFSFSQSAPRTIGGTYYNGGVPYKNLQLLWYHHDFETLPLQLSGIFVNQGLEVGRSTASKTTYRQTMGVWSKYLYRDYFARTEVYCQTGHDAQERKLAAFLLGLRIGREDKQWGATMGLDYVSGSDGSDAGRSRSFILLCGSTHEYHGAMDYFTASSMLPCGLLDISLEGYYLPPVRGLKVNAAYHNFTTGSKRARLHRFLGQEIDLGASYELLPDVTLSAGYSMMLPTSVMTFYLGGDNKLWQDWGWLSLSVSPQTFATKLRFKKK